MRVLVMGATGFIGRALIPRLQCDGHAVVAWVRSPARARSLLGGEVELVHADTAPDGCCHTKSAWPSLSKSVRLGVAMQVLGWVIVTCPSVQSESPLQKTPAGARSVTTVP